MFHALVRACLYLRSRDPSHRREQLLPYARIASHQLGNSQTTGGVCNVNRTAGNYWEPQLPMFGEFLGLN